MNNYVNCKISGIPSLIINPPDIPRATVLLYHGWASKIENSQQLLLPVTKMRGGENSKREPVTGNFSYKLILKRK